jgi:hypothetical protein
MPKYDHNCIKNDVCDMAVCDGAGECAHALTEEELITKIESDLTSIGRKLDHIIECLTQKNMK